MSGRGKRRAAIVGAAVGVLLLGSLGVWWWAEQALARGLARWQAAMAAQGVAVSIGDAAAGGWPVAATRTLNELEIVAGLARVRVERAVLRLSALVPDTLLVDLPGPVEVAVPGAPPVRLEARAWQARLSRDPATPLALDASDLRARWTPPDGAAQEATAALAHVGLGPAPGGVAATFSAQSVGLPGAGLPLGARIASVSGELGVAGVPPAPFLTAPALAAWRDAGGSVTVRRFALGYGPLGLAGSGRFALDEALQPAGSGDLRIVGYAETLAALAAGHAISGHVASAAGAVLGLLAQTPPGGGAPRVDTRVTLTEGIVSVAGFPLRRLPPVVWPAGP